MAPVSAAALSPAQRPLGSGLPAPVPGSPPSPSGWTQPSSFCGETGSSRRRRSSRGRKFPFWLLSYSSSVRAGRGFGARKSQDTASPRAGKPLVTRAWVRVLPGLPLVDPRTPLCCLFQNAVPSRDTNPEIKSSRSPRKGDGVPWCGGLFLAHSASVQTVSTGFPRMTRPVRPPDHRPQPRGGRAGHSRPTNMARALTPSARPPLAFQDSFSWPSVPWPHLPSVPWERMRGRTEAKQRRLPFSCPSSSASSSQE